MKRAFFLAIVACAWAGTASAHHPSQWHGDRLAAAQAAYYPWHGWYYNAEWGIPAAVVVPPTAEAQTHYNWGVGSTRVTHIGPQFKANYPGYSEYNRQLFRPMPPWPSDTDQMGYYYVRGPWR